MCVVEKIALNYMHSMYKKDPRYIIDPYEEKRIQYTSMDSK